MNKILNISTRNILLSLIVLFVLSKSVSAQHTQTLSFNADDGDIHMLNEVGGIVIANNDTVRINMVLPADARPEEYKEVDLQKDDIILMINGASIKTIDDFKDAYDKIEKGEEIKMGVRRGRDLMIVTFNKSKKESGMKMMVMSGPEGDDAEATFTQNGGNFNINLSGDIEGMLPLLELGMILGEEEGVKILQILPNIKDVFPKDKFMVDDLITSVNGNKIETTDEFSKIFTSIAPGTEVKMSLVRDGKTIEETFDKKESKMKTITK